MRFRLIHVVIQRLFLSRFRKLKSTEPSGIRFSEAITNFLWKGEERTPCSFGRDSRSCIKLLLLQHSNQRVCPFSFNVRLFFCLFFPHLASVELWHLYFMLSSGWLHAEMTLLLWDKITKMNSLSLDKLLHIIFSNLRAKIISIFFYQGRKRKTKNIYIYSRLNNEGKRKLK